MKTITLADALGWNPCYTDEKTTFLAETLFPGKTEVSAMDILSVDPRKLSIKDQIWLVLHPELIGKPIAVEFACLCSERALRREQKAGREPRRDAWTAIEVTRRYMNGKASAEELQAAAAAAAEAAAETEAGAAWLAAAAAAASTAAARPASTAAAWAAAAAASTAAAWAAEAPAEASERLAQRKDLISLLQTEQQK